MAISKLYEDVEQVLKFPNELGENGTTQEEFQEYIRNVHGVLENVVKSIGLWQPQTVFNTNDIISSPSMRAGTLAMVTNGGTTGSSEPTWSNTGTTISDGSVTYIIIPRYVQIASEKEIEDGTSTTKAVSPAGLSKITENLTKYTDESIETVNKTIDDKGNSLLKYVNQFVGTSRYYRQALPSTSNTIILISPTVVTINGSVYENTSAVSLDLSKVVSWDSSNLIANVNRAGKDFYIYACEPTDGTVPKFVLSANSTVPTGYTATNSRKIGGFHCLCADVGTIEGHSLSGYVAGDILPASVWDLLHRCKGENEGMVYDEADDVWLGIYLLSYDNGKAVSRYNGVILDGGSTPKTHGLWFTETLAKQHMRLPYLHEFFTALKGCQERVNIQGSKDWNTTGGHVYTNGVRCISNIGLEDPTGFMWQWSNNYGMAGGSEWGSSTYDSNVDSESRGGSYGNLWLPLVGGRWSDGSNCGSRSVAGSCVAAYRDANNGARCASEPRVVSLQV